MSYVYILSNFTNRVLYIGVTNHLVRRVYEHKNRLVEGFTSKYHLNKLVYYECFSDITQAIAREKVLKKWNRQWKERLITAFNPEWKDLYSEVGF